MYRVIWEVAFLGTGEKAPPAYQGQRRRLWVNTETALGECYVFSDVLHVLYSRPRRVGLVLGQRCRRLTGTEPAIGCDAGPILNWNWVGKLTSSVRDTS